MRPLLDKIGTRWVLIALVVAAVAFVAGVNYQLRTGGGILAQGVTPTPTSIYAINTPTDAELDAAIATAVAKNLPTAVVRVIDPKTGKPVEDSPVAVMSNEEADLQAAYQVAEETFDRASVWSHVRFGQLTANLQEYLGANPDRVIYLQKIDRTIHLPKDIMIRWIMSDDTHPKPSVCDDPADGCPTSLPAYVLYDTALGVNKNYMPNMSIIVDGSGYVFVRDSDTLPGGFTFLSELKVIRRDSR